MCKEHSSSDLHKIGYDVKALILVYAVAFNKEVFPFEIKEELLPRVAWFTLAL